MRARCLAFEDGRGCSRTESPSIDSTSLRRERPRLAGGWPEVDVPDERAHAADVFDAAALDRARLSERGRG